MAAAVVAVVGMRSGGVIDASGDPAQEIRSSAPPIETQPPVAVMPPVAQRPAAPQPAMISPPVTVSPMLPLPPPGASRPTPTRPVAPQIVAIPPVDPATLERVEPRAPLSEIAHALPLKKPRPKPLLFRPVAESASVISAGGYTITIAGIDPVDFDETCTSSTGRAWQCGRAARAAFRGFLRGRAVTCEFPDGEVPDAVTATCRLGNYDIGGWLVANGWARSAGDIYAEPAEVARAQGRGIYGPGPAELPADFDTRLTLPEGSGQLDGPGGQGISILPDPLEDGEPVPVDAGVPRLATPPG